jgi:hypothetical protein
MMPADIFSNINPNTWEIELTASKYERERVVRKASGKVTREIRVDSVFVNVRLNCRWHVVRYVTS